MVATNGASSGDKKFLIFGKTGWIGGLLGDLLKEQGGQCATCLGLHPCHARRHRSGIWHRSRPLHVHGLDGSW